QEIDWNEDRKVAVPMAGGLDHRIELCDQVIPVQFPRTCPVHNPTERERPKRLAIPSHVPFHVSPPPRTIQLRLAVVLLTVPQQLLWAKCECLRLCQSQL